MNAEASEDLDLDGLKWGPKIPQKCNMSLTILYITSHNVMYLHLFCEWHILPKKVIQGLQITLWVAFLHVFAFNISNLWYNRNHVTFSMVDGRGFIPLDLSSIFLLSTCILYQNKKTNIYYRVRTFKTGSFYACISSSTRSCGWKLSRTMAYAAIYPKLEFSLHRKASTKPQDL